MAELNKNEKDPIAGVYGEEGELIMYEHAHVSILSQVLFGFMLALLAGQVCKHISLLTKIPYTPIITILGIVIQLASSS